MSNYSDSYFSEDNINSSWYKVFHLIRDKSKVLDIGCSSGNFGKVLIDKKKCIVDGVEPYASDAKLASKKLQKVWVINIETDDLTELGKSNYDYIYFGDVIEHLVHPIETLKRIKPLLKQSGGVLFSIPNMGHVGVRLDLLEGRLQATETGLLDKTHLHFYTQDEVTRVFGEAGYSIEHLDFVKKDYPKELLEQHLAKIGLTPNNKFYDLMQKTNAAAFQFVGLAKPSKTRQRKLPDFGPIDMFENFYNDTKTNYELEIEGLKREVEKLKKNEPIYRKAARKARRNFSKK